MSFGLRTGGVAGEGIRYLGAAAAALAVDLAAYSTLIRLAGVHYLVAAPVGYLLGLLTVYALCIRWVFAVRRLSSARAEFAVFAAIGLAGMALNQVVVYASVDHLGMTYEPAKLLSAAASFCFGFAVRKLMLFTGRR